MEPVSWSAGVGRKHLFLHNLDHTKRLTRLPTGRLFGFLFVFLSKNLAPILSDSKTVDFSSLATEPSLDCQYNGFTDNGWNDKGSALYETMIKML